MNNSIRLEHAFLYVSDLGRSLRFYERLLPGWAVRWEGQAERWEGGAAPGRRTGFSRRSGGA